MNRLVALLALFACAGLGCESGGESPGEGAGGRGGMGGRDSTGSGAGLCAPCAKASDCASGICLRNDQTGAQFCGQDCRDAPCPVGYSCRSVRDRENAKQCIPAAGTCSATGGTGGASAPPPGDGGRGGQGQTGGAPATGGRGGGGAAGTSPPSGPCDPGFLGPFCEGNTIIGFEGPQVPVEPTLADVRRYSLAAVNHLRARTCLPALEADDCLDEIAQTALMSTPLSHNYFIQNCLGKASCRCNWAQENIGAASGTSRTWKDGVAVPLCAMMTEPKGVGHRKNIESPTWKRLGIGITWTRNGASWHHEFGR